MDAMFRMVGRRGASGGGGRPAHGFRWRVCPEQIRAALDAGGCVGTAAAGAVRRGAAAARGGAALGTGAEG
eukprot:6174218-Pleurochrysis_carterae.AAC.2